ncbi:MAG: hypothetical protein M1839_000737 [Geoglossum umbratile]|nr:MAG: hypothetical protein M1839_000737 [Geoglossum umbratile]
MRDSFSRILGEAVVDPEEESFLIFSQPILSQNLGFVDSCSSTLELVVANKSLSIHQSPTILSSNRKGGTTGAVLWKITPIFADWISSPQNALFQHAIFKSDSTVLELGCGVSGVLPLTLAPKIGRYIATDQEYVLRLLKRNIEENTPESVAAYGIDSKRTASNKRSRKHTSASTPSHLQRPMAGEIEVMALDWELTSTSTLPALLSNNNTPTKATQPLGLDAVIACDCIYNDALVMPFVQTCADLCGLRKQSCPGNSAHADQANPTVCIIAQQLRSPEVFEAWLSAFCERFRVWRVPDAMLSEELREGKGFAVHIGVLKDWM